MPRGNDVGVRGNGGVLCFSLGSRLRGNDGPCGNDGGVCGNGGGISGVTLTLALSRRAGEGIGVVGGRGDDGMEMETRKKPGAVFNPVLLRERSWICASAVKRRRQS